MKVWVVQFIPRGMLCSECNAEIYGVFDSYKKAKECALYELKNDLEFNDFVVNAEEFDNFENHNKEHEDIHIMVFADFEENYSEYYMLSIIPMGVK